MRSDKAIEGEALETLLQLLKDEATWTTQELADQLLDDLGLQVNRRTVGKALRNAGFTFKRGPSGRQLSSAKTSWRREMSFAGPSRSWTPTTSSL